MTDTAAKPATSPPGNTEYIILVQGENTSVWHGFAKRQNARSAKTAIQQHAAATDAKSGVFVAIPTRSWRPVTVTVETKTTIRLS